MPKMRQTHFVRQTKKKKEHKQYTNKRARTPTSEPKQKINKTVRGKMTISLENVLEWQANQENGQNEAKYIYFSSRMPGQMANGNDRESTVSKPGAWTTGKTKFVCKVSRHSQNF